MGDRRLPPLFILINRFSGEARPLPPPEKLLSNLPFTRNGRASFHLRQLFQLLIHMLAERAPNRVSVNQCLRFGEISREPLKDAAQSPRANPLKNAVRRSKGNPSRTGRLERTARRLIFERAHKSRRSFPSHGRIILSGAAQCPAGVCVRKGESSARKEPANATRRGQAAENAIARLPCRRRESPRILRAIKGPVRFAGTGWIYATTI